MKRIEGKNRVNRGKVLPARELLGEAHLTNLADKKTSSSRVRCGLRDFYFGRDDFQELT
jgi:hypothetical protein